MLAGPRQLHFVVLRARVAAAGTALHFSGPFVPTQDRGCLDCVQHKTKPATGTPYGKRLPCPHDRGDREAGIDGDRAEEALVDPPPRCDRDTNAKDGSTVGYAHLPPLTRASYEGGRIADDTVQRHRKGAFSATVGARRKLRFSLWRRGPSSSSAPKARPA